MWRKSGRMFAVVGAAAAIAALLAGPASALPVLGHTCDGFEATHVGTNGNDRIDGTPGRDVIVALGGRDVIRGLGGNDIICGGPGGDTLVGGTGRDRLFGQGGNDRLLGNLGRDQLTGGSGSDLLRGGGGPDSIVANNGFDTVLGGAGVDRCKFDRNDVYLECEGGDVRGFTGLGAGTTDIDVGPEFRVSSFVHQGETLPVYVVDLSIGNFDGVPISITITDESGQQLGQLVEESGFYFGAVMVIGQPATIEAQSNGGYYDISFKKPKLIETLSRGWIAFDTESRVVFIEPAVSGPNASALFDIVGGTGAVTMWTMAPNQAPIFHVSNETVTEPSSRQLVLPDGTFLAGVEAAGAEWELSFDD